MTDGWGTWWHAWPARGTWEPRLGDDHGVLCAPPLLPALVGKHRGTGDGHGVPSPRTRPGRVHRTNPAGDAPGGQAAGLAFPWWRRHLSGVRSRRGWRRASGAARAAGMLTVARAIQRDGASR